MIMLTHLNNAYYINYTGVDPKHKVWEATGIGIGIGIGIGS